MKSFLFIMFMLMCTSMHSMAGANRLGRIENQLKSIDSKLNANSIDLSTLKTDVADTNRKLDMLLELLNGTQTSQQVDDTKDIQPDDRQATHRLSASRDLENTIKDEVSRVRRAFLSEKKKLSLQQKENEAQFIGFAEKLNTTLNRLDNMHESKWTKASNSINESVTSVLGNVQDEIGYKLMEWNQTIHDHVNEMNEKLHSRLDKLDSSIKSWNSSIQESLTNVSNTVVSSTNSSMNKLDTLTNNMQHEMESTLTKIGRTVDSMNYTQDLSKIANNLELHDNKTERLFNEVLQSNADGFTKSNNVIQSHDSETRRLLSVILRETNRVRVVGSPSRYGIEGEMEVYVNGAWGKVCAEGFDDTDADVACKALGYRTGKDTTSRSFNYRLFHEPVMNNVKCKGTENSLQECPHERRNYCLRGTGTVTVKCSW